MNIIEWSDFEKVDLRVGTILKAEAFKEAKKPAYKIVVDLGALGEKKSSAQLTKLYKASELVGKQVLCVCNLTPRQIGPIMSEVLITGFVLDDGAVVLATPERKLPNGTKLG
jgi:tRNA-binding protein